MHKYLGKEKQWVIELLDKGDLYNIGIKDMYLISCLTVRAQRQEFLRGRSKGISARMQAAAGVKMCETAAWYWAMRWIWERFDFPEEPEKRRRIAPYQAAFLGRMKAEFNKSWKKSQVPIYVLEPERVFPGFQWTSFSRDAFRHAYENYKDGNGFTGS